MTYNPEKLAKLKEVYREQVTIGLTTVPPLIKTTWYDGTEASIDHYIDLAWAVIKNHGLAAVSFDSTGWKMTAKVLNIRSTKRGYEEYLR